MGTLLGFDYGTRRIGVAVGQTVTRSARPLCTLHSRDGGVNWPEVTHLLEEWQPEALVVGLPVHMDGTEHELTKAARRFGNRLAGRYNLRVFFMDERLSSDEAERLLAAEGRGGKKQDVDRVAAQIILQAWLDQQPHDT